MTGFNINEIKRKAKVSPRRIVLPEGGDERILKAAELSVEEKYAHPILLGEEDEIQNKASAFGISLDGISLINPRSSTALSLYIHEYSKMRGVSQAVARRILEKPIYFGAMMAGMGDADGMVAGITHPSADVIGACELIIGLDEGVMLPSSFFIIDAPNFSGGESGILLFADASVNVDPTPEQLANIAITTANTARRLLGWEPRVAMLSFSTKGSAVHPCVDKVVEATEIIKKIASDLLVNGELQADASLLPEVAKRKIENCSPVAGRANILIFPNLDAANIAYKLVQILANATAYGPILQGFSRPACDLSRGATFEEVAGVIAIDVVLAQKLRRVKIMR